MARSTHSRTSIALAVAALAHVGLFAVWRGSTSASKSVDRAPANPVPAATEAFALSTVSLVALPSEAKKNTVEGAADVWHSDDGAATSSAVVAPGRETGTRAVGERGAPSATARNDRSTRNTGLWNSREQSQAMHASRAPRGRTTPESIERDTESRFSNRRRDRAHARPGQDADRVGTEDGRGQGGAPGLDGSEWLSVDPRFDGAPKATRAEVVAVVSPAPDAPRRATGHVATENSERGAATQWASAAELSNRPEASAFDLGAPSARGRVGAGADGRGRSVANQGGRGRAANNGTGGANTPTTTRASRSNPYFYDMYRRIDAKLKFPRKLAVALEQGEVVLRFRLDAKGRVHGLVVAKSSEFQEFDDEALRAFKAAGPFGAVPQALLAGRDRLSVVAPYYFRNPLIR